MSAPEAPPDLDAVLALPGLERYAYFVAQVARREEAWGLVAAGWAVQSDGHGTSAIGLWPAPEYARLCATDAWRDYVASAIPLRALLHQLLPALEDEGLWVLVFPTPTARGVLVNPASLADELTHARPSAS